MSTSSRLIGAALPLIGILLMASLAGCLIYPTHRTFVPRTVGTLMTEGEHVEGVQVYRTEVLGDMPCRSVPDTIDVTGADGLFDLPSVSRPTMDVFVPLAIMESPRQWWSMCFVSGADTLVHRDSAIPPHAVVQYACETTAFPDSAFAEPRGCEWLCSGMDGARCD